MERNQRHIDQLFRDRLLGHQETPPAPVWEALELRLDQQKRRRLLPLLWLRWVGLALVLAMLIGSAFYRTKHHASPITARTNGSMRPTLNHTPEFTAKTKTENSQPTRVNANNTPQISPKAINKTLSTKRHITPPDADSSKSHIHLEKRHMLPQAAPTANGSNRSHTEPLLAVLPTYENNKQQTPAATPPRTDTQTRPILTEARNGRAAPTDNHSLTEKAATNVALVAFPQDSSAAKTRATVSIATSNLRPNNPRATASQHTLVHKASQADEVVRPQKKLLTGSHNPTPSNPLENQTINERIAAADKQPLQTLRTIRLHPSTKMTNGLQIAEAGARLAYAIPEISFPHNRRKRTRTDDSRMLLASKTTTTTSNPSAPSNKATSAVETNAQTPPSASPKKQPIAWNLPFDAGFKAGSEQSLGRVSIQQLFIAPFLQWRRTDRFSFLFQPTLRIAYLNQVMPVLAATPFYQVKQTSMDSSDSWIIGNPTLQRTYTYRQQYDSVVVSLRAPAQRYLEVELPAMVQVQLTKEFAFLGGLSLTIGKIMKLEQVRQSYSGLERIGSVTKDINITNPDPYLPPPDPGSFFTYNTTDIAALSGRQYNTPNSPIFRTGIMIGFAYNPNRHWQFDLLLRQNLPNLQIIANDRVRQAYLQPNIRLNVGYRLFTARERR